MIQFLLRFLQFVAPNKVKEEGEQASERKESSDSI